MVATVLTVYGIETLSILCFKSLNLIGVATVLTVYGIETWCNLWSSSCGSKLQQYLPFTVLKLQHVFRTSQILFRLQQYLPFTVLKPIINWNGNFILLLQQYLPFTVLKLKIECIMQKDKFPELQQYLPFTVLKLVSKNADSITCPAQLQQYLPFTVLKHHIRQYRLHIYYDHRCNSTYRLRY